jgi:molecular chaperone GrpE
MKDNGKELIRDTGEKKNNTEEAPSGPDEKKNEDVVETVFEKDEAEGMRNSLSEMNEKYVRLYADFENFKKITVKNREELLKYSNEDILRDLLTVMDHLELALQHSSDSESINSLTEGVDLTLKELKTLLERYGLIGIEALGKPFDPNVHHAMSQIETDEADENTVVEEFRKGYKLNDRVLRAALVGVSKRPPQEAETTETEEEE